MAKRARSSRPAEPGLFDVPAAPSDAPAASGGAAPVRGDTRPARATEPARSVEPERAAAPARSSEPPCYSVSELTAELKAHLEGLGRVRVEGELSSLRRPASGHVYFDLKDDGARIACAVWRSQTSRILRFELEEGQQLVIHGRLDVYAPRGSYSLIVDRIEPVGVGALLAKLEELKRELAAQGWFERARPLPAMPRMVGLVTSRDGAALQDFLRTRSLRWPGYPVRLCHASVQGPLAAGEIADAIDRLDASGVDVIVVCRGGGSLEDLWAFNEREVATAIRRASVPVVSGVGHESDTTLADLVADHRAHTPTDAAQTVLPDRDALQTRLTRTGNFLIQAMHERLDERIDGVRRLAGRPVLRDADWILRERTGALAARRAQLQLATRALVQGAGHRLADHARRLERQSPGAQVERRARRVDVAGRALTRHGERAVEGAQQRVALLARSLEGLSPLRVLARGFSVTRLEGDRKPIVRAADVTVGDELETRVHEGHIVSKVTGTRPAASSDDGASA